MARTFKGAIVIGGLSTHIASIVGVDPHGQDSPTYSLGLDIDACLAMKMIILRGNVYYLSFKSMIMALANQECATVQNKRNRKVVLDIDFEEEQPKPIAS